MLHLKSFILICKAAPLPGSKRERERARERVREREREREERRGSRSPPQPQLAHRLSLSWLLAPAAAVAAAPAAMEQALKCFNVTKEQLQAAVAFVKSPRAHWLRMRKKWQLKLTIGSSGESWLSAKTSGNKWGVGCIVCAAGAADVHAPGQDLAFCQYAVTSHRAMQLDNFRRHAASKFHQQALSLYLKQDDAEPVGAPSRKAFLAVWGELSKGVSPRSPVTDVSRGGGRKQYRMLACLCEGMWALDRRWLRAARELSITMFADGSKGRVMFRMTAANQDLEVRHFMVGQARLTGKDIPGAPEVVSMFKRVLTNFCTVRKKGPGPAARPGRAANAVAQPSKQRGFDRALYDKLRRHIKALCADAASDEQLAGRLMQVRDAASGKTFLPNIITTIKDKPHAGRRT
jgi:hypothetical protein